MRSAPFPEMNGTLIGDDLAQIFVYTNSITDGLASPLILLSFFLIVTIGSMLFQWRFSARIKPEASFAAGSFATLGMAVIMSSVNGLLDPIYLIMSAFIMILSIIWLIFSPTDEYN